MDPPVSAEDLIALAKRMLEESQRLAEMAEKAIRASMTITNARDVRVADTALSNDSVEPSVEPH